ncbi:hypothetical protein EXS85_01080 [Helicobacter pylori]|nr:hypothetical protein [Helicobacter pylori]
MLSTSEMMSIQLRWFLKPTSMFIGGFSLPLHSTKNTTNPKMTANIKPTFFVTPIIKPFYCKFS